MSINYIEHNSIMPEKSRHCIHHLIRYNIVSVPTMKVYITVKANNILSLQFLLPLPTLLPWGFPKRSHNIQYDLHTSTIPSNTLPPPFFDGTKLSHLCVLIIQIYNRLPARTKCVTDHAHNLTNLINQQQLITRVLGIYIYNTTAVHIGKSSVTTNGRWLQVYYIRVYTTCRPAHNRALPHLPRTTKRCW